MAEEQRQSRGNVPIPLSRRLRWWRRKLAPLLVWIVAVFCAVMLWDFESAEFEAEAVVESRSVPVAPLAEGRIQGLSVDLFDKVRPGQTLAVMDDSLIRAELVIADAEFSRLRAELSAAESRLRWEDKIEKRDSADDRRRFALDVESARLDYLDRLTQYEVDQVDMERLGVLMERQKRLVDNKVLDESTYEQTLLTFEAQKKRVAESREALEVAQKNLEQTRERRKQADSKELDPETREILAPFREAVRVQEARIAEAKARRATLVIKAPLEGKVAQIFHQPGETVLAGDPIMTIADSASGRVIAYVDEEKADNVAEGQTAILSSARPRSRQVTAVVKKISPQVEMDPQRLQRNPAVLQWGLPVLLGEVPADAFFPGEKIKVKFSRL